MMFVADVHLAIIIRTTRAGSATTLALVGDVHRGLKVVQTLVSASGIPS